MSTCIVCGHAFGPDHKGQKVCQRCVNKLRSDYDWLSLQTPTGKNVRSKHCIICGKPVVGRRKFTCSNICAGKWREAYIEIRHDHWIENARKYSARKRAGLVRKKKQPPLPEAAPWATDAQRRWQELGRSRVLAARVPYRHHEELDKDIQEARRRGLSYGYWMARKTGILL